LQNITTARYECSKRLQWYTRYYERFSLPHLILH